MATDSIERVPYRIGYSFRNPDILKPLTRTRNPFWQIHYKGKGPSEIKRDMWKRGRLREYPSIWRRAAKANTVKGLGEMERQEQELPSFYELGAAPVATEKAPDAVVRSPFGQLLNVALTGFKTVVEEESKLQQIKAGVVPQGMFPFIPQQFQGTGGIGLLGIGLAVGLGALLLRK